MKMQVIFIIPIHPERRAAPSHNLWKPNDFRNAQSLYPQLIRGYYTQTQRILNGKNVLLDLQKGG